MLDTFVFGDVDRISPEAPVPVLHVHEERRVLGGAGNVIRNLAGLGVKTHFIGAIGTDDIGKIVRNELSQISEVESFLAEIPQAVTPHKIRYIAHQQLLRADYEQVVPVQWNDILNEQVLKALKQVDMMLLSDYAKGFFTPEITKHLIGLARTQNVPVIVDPKGTDWERYRGATILTPNKKELIQAAHKPCPTTEDLAAAAREIAEKLDVKGILVTLGSEGMLYVERSGREILVKTMAKEVYDVSGAGDTVISVLAAALAGGMEIEEAIHLANLSAGVVVSKLGTAPIYWDDLCTVLHAEETRSKIVTPIQLVEHIQKFRHRKRRIGFTNGCFDLLHKGHLSLLYEAKSQCDVLIVAINSDASVKRLKGESRPIQSEDTRLTVIAALQVVDFVVLFDEETPLLLIEKLLPDVLIKGGDYTAETIVGSDVVTKRGGRVHIVPTVVGHSTTLTVEKIGLVDN